MPRIVFLLALGLQCAPLAAQGPIALYCARGAGDYPDVEMTLDERGGHVVHVVYVGFRPSPARADWTLRDCLKTAIKLDGSRDITAWLWYREPRSRSPRELLRPTALVYRAASRGVVAQSN